MPEHQHVLPQARSAPAAAALGALFSVALAITLFAAGFFACTLAPTTALLSRMTSDFGTSAFLPEDTVTLAVATRDFTVDPYAQGQEAATEKLAEAVLAAAGRSAAASSPKASRWTEVRFVQPSVSANGAENAPVSSDGDGRSSAASAPSSSSQSGDTLSLDLRKQSSGTAAAGSTGGVTNAPDDSLSAATASMYALAAQGASYALGPDEISHLVDCNTLINSTVPVLVVIAIVALACGVGLGLVGGKRSMGRALGAAPAVLLAAMIGLAVWAAADFHGFFAAFHGLLFPQGNWTFPFDSLLICMLPTGFWIGMAIMWVVVTVGLSVASIVIGRRLLRR